MFRRAMVDLWLQRGSDACGHSKDWNFFGLSQVWIWFFLRSGFYLVFRSLMQKCSFINRQSNNYPGNTVVYKIISKTAKGNHLEHFNNPEPFDQDQKANKENPLLTAGDQKGSGVEDLACV
jgi:hypothetical protein